MSYFLAWKGWICFYHLWSDTCYKYNKFQYSYMFECNFSVNEYGLTFLFELNVCKTQYNGKVWNKWTVVYGSKNTILKVVYCL